VAGVRGREGQNLRWGYEGAWGGVRLSRSCSMAGGVRGGVWGRGLGKARLGAGAARNRLGWDGGPRHGGCGGVGCPVWGGGGKVWAWGWGGGWVGIGGAGVAVWGGPLSLSHTMTAHDNVIRSARHYERRRPRRAAPVGIYARNAHNRHKIGRPCSRSGGKSADAPVCVIIPGGAGEEQALVLERAIGVEGIPAGKRGAMERVPAGRRGKEENEFRAVCVGVRQQRRQQRHAVMRLQTSSPRCQRR